MKRSLSLFLAVLMCIGLICAIAPVSRAEESPVKKDGRSITSADELRVNDIITFGTYPFRSYDSYAPIEWLVIKKSGNKVMLLTRDVIDSHPFHGNYYKINWYSCDLNTWLNDTFLSNAFTTAEQNMINGSITIPSITDARALPKNILNTGFTPYAISRGGDGAQCIWWLRDGNRMLLLNNGDEINCASAVKDGQILEASFKANFNGKGVRPMLQIDFDRRESSSSYYVEEPKEDWPTEGMRKGGRAVTSINDLKLYDDITYGSYPYDDYGTYQPIRWVVIGKKGNKVKLISTFGLDCKKYHEANANVSWRLCNLNEWLNDTFRETAFSTADQAAIVGDITILTEAEARELPIEYRATRSTEYAISRGADDSRCIWWLRDTAMREIQGRLSPYAACCASAVLESGEIVSACYSVSLGNKTVRPVIEVDVSRLPY